MKKQFFQCEQMILKSETSKGNREGDHELFTLCTVFTIIEDLSGKNLQMDGASLRHILIKRVTNQLCME